MIGTATAKYNIEKSPHNHLLGGISTNPTKASHISPFFQPPSSDFKTRTIVVSKLSRTRSEDTYGNKQVRNQSRILIPISSILGLAPLDISVRSVNDHAGEEERVEPGKRTAEAGDQSPGESKV